MSGAKRVNKILTITMALLLAFSTMVLGGCAGETGSKDFTLEPKVTSPVIGTDGVLKVGVDSGETPFAGKYEGKIVGIDVDVAAALAEELGLTLEIVDTAGQSADTLLANGTVDVVMHVEQTGGSTIQGIQVGPYLTSGPALFCVVNSDTVPTVDIKSLAGTKIAAQRESLSAWSLEELIGPGTADPKEKLEEAFAAAVQGPVNYAAADAVVGSYLAIKDFDDLACVKMLGTPIGVYAGVAKSSTQLADALTDALRAIRDNGVLKTVISKWLGPVSASVVMGDSAVTSQSTSISNSPSSTGASGNTGNSNPTSAPTLPSGQEDLGDDLPDPSNAG